MNLEISYVNYFQQSGLDDPARGKIVVWLHNLTLLK